MSKEDFDKKSYSSLAFPESSQEFFKSSQDRTYLKRFGRYFNIEDEFQTLRAMYSIIPDNVPQPLTLVTDDEGYPAGYIMEKVPGDTLYDLKDDLETPDETNYLYNSVRELVDEIHQSDVVHADLGAQNVMVTPSYQVMLIDPAGVPPGEYTEEGKYWDEFNLKGIQKLLIDDQKDEHTLEL